MSRLHRQLPQLQSLVYFESAARHLNFTAAAEELGTTQPAVSHRVRSMEEHLGVSLFFRQHRGVKLTEEGSRLYQTVRQSLDALRLTTEAVRVQDEQRSLTLATDFGFAKLWLMPRIRDLQQAIPGLQLRILTSQDQIDPRQETIDFSIHFNGPMADPNAELLFPEYVVPVCSPALLDRHSPIRSTDDLARLPLLHLQQVEPTRWLDWDEWFRLQGGHPGTVSSNLTFNDYSMVIQAAISGNGVALGWAPLVDELLEQGQLAVAYDRPVKTARGCFLITPPFSRTSGLRARFRDWLLSECAKGQLAGLLTPSPPSPPPQAIAG